jgi:hypothetical protein
VTSACWPEERVMGELLMADLRAEAGFGRGEWKPTTGC